MTRPLTPANKTPDSNWTWQDGLLILAIISLILAIVRTASNFSGTFNPNLTISTNISALPAYTAQTLVRMGVAYFLSLVFTLVYAYTAYRSRIAALILIPLLDILQSIPVLSFLPGVVLALIALFPGQRIGVELASILLIFTGMTWNMTFSFYQSLRSIPQELLEAARVYRLNLWQRFWTLELPAGAIGLVWNSVMSFAGGWFFLIAIESFTLGKRDFRLPGLGSFLGTAANKEDYTALLWGLVVLIGVIVAIDFFVWRPLIAWAEKFKLEMVEAESTPQSWILDILRRSPTFRILSDRFLQPFRTALDYGLIRAFPVRTLQINPKGKFNVPELVNWLFLSGFSLIVLWGTWEAVLLLKKLDWAEWQQVMIAAGFTALRVIVALVLSLLWTVPVGVAIGRNPRLAQILQPVVQIAASVPATALFPVLLLWLTRVAGGLNIASVALMMLGTMWYILFNVIAGAQSIPSDLLEAARVYKLSRVQRWRTLILPGIFPYLITGIITAVGGAWNASIVSEYVTFQGHVKTTTGLGATISQATASGNFALLLAATTVMSLLVVLTNRLVWRPLYRLAQEKYQLLV
ncbi:ABC transporter permease subunit [Aetokthonos hydrillicola Thurmond2011]|jgi:NitT/TauT family transport system permease protein|uniref:ABC transporter permease subunit n=1 Tax=Aetokthonos hydrillicola Thurmond2011 TaxID=2712845 RepID=A0AAP5I5Z4_9CYAN|nr:ABC transporter permease subunit [Aetokthonos hydrillicola]MBO3460973.1 ABC transporter permease subunit [Aetokthonos hydrillicola CCALA 1050]MBW4583647.1 ABC transporter permease subunit [Aetokthonos hydrillicola CCALA 1050]MDR9895658.1 ABC transporter permease subunit [Aetokthonos hydrillicola Thurmond2011]